MKLAKNELSEVVRPKLQKRSALKLADRNYPRNEA
jgi:hypothetical protein